MARIDTSKWSRVDHVKAPEAEPQDPNHLPIYSVDLLAKLEVLFRRPVLLPGHQTADHQWYAEGQQSVLEVIRGMKQRTEEDPTNVLR